jgi:hypothetical protein
MQCADALAPPPPGPRALHITKSGHEPNVGSLAAIVGLHLSLLARNVSRKQPLFAGPGAAVCGPLHLAFKWLRMIFRLWKNQTPYHEGTYVAA